MGFLIASLDVTAEQREALLSLLPEMTAVQLEDLSNILEASYLQAATKDEDAKLSGELKNIETEYEEKISQINENTAEALDDIA